GVVPRGLVWRGAAPSSPRGRAGCSRAGSGDFLALSCTRLLACREGPRFLDGRLDRLAFPACQVVAVAACDAERDDVLEELARLATSLFHQARLVVLQALLQLSPIGGEFRRRSSPARGRRAFGLARRLGSRRRLFGQGELREPNLFGELPLLRV